MCGCQPCAAESWSPTIYGGGSCPPLPPLEPCEIIEGVNYYHPCHQLVPMARQLDCVDASACVCDHELGCRLKAAEYLYTTCQLPGESYWLGLCYHAIASIELSRMYELYQESMAMAISLGKTFSMPVPTILNSGYFGIQLQSLLASNSDHIGMVAIC
jgi:hypothetical protein